VCFFIGDEGELFLLYLARGRTLAAADPAREAALITAALAVGDGGRNLVAAALVCFEAAANRFCGRSDGAFLYLGRFLAPTTLRVAPFQPRRFHLNGAAGDGVAVQIGDDDLYVQRLPALHEGAL